MNKKIVLILGIILNCTTALPALSQCTISANGVAFGSYDVFSSTKKESTGNINYNCTSGTPHFTIYLSKGNAPSYNPRKLTSGNHSLNYNLYLDAAGLQIWGDTTDSTNQYSSSNLTGNVIIYGIIAPMQNVSVGNYTDSITATINF
ncbi:MAG: spore coat U domain-containing protein [Nostoc sp.]|uniref:Csu type fimbrial protein n=1 Tax=Nostoc sp. TaxID=1180 RepID=UPI002FF8032B